MQHNRRPTVEPAARVEKGGAPAGSCTAATIADTRRASVFARGRFTGAATRSAVILLFFFDVELLIKREYRGPTQHVMSGCIGSPTNKLEKDWRVSSCGGALIGPTWASCEASAELSIMGAASSQK